MAEYREGIAGVGELNAFLLGFMVFVVSLLVMNFML